MKPNADEPRVPKSNSGPKPNAMGDLKSLPMPKLQAKLGSSPDGLSQAEAQKRLTQYGPNEIQEKKANPFLKLLTYFWGPIPWMIESGCDPFGDRTSLGRFLDYPGFAFNERNSWLLGRISGWKCY